MSQANKDLVRSYVSAFNRGDIDAVCALFAEDAEVQGALKRGGLEDVKPVWLALHHGLSMQLSVEEMVCEADTVAVRFTERGCFRGDFLGHAPTGKEYEVVAMEWFTIRDGKIRRRWGARDVASISRQCSLPLG